MLPILLPLPEPGCPAPRGPAAFVAEDGAAYVASRGPRHTCWWRVDELGDATLIGVAPNDSAPRWIIDGRVFEPAPGQALSLGRPDVAQPRP